MGITRVNPIVRMKRTKKREIPIHRVQAADSRCCTACSASNNATRQNVRNTGADMTMRDSSTTNGESPKSAAIAKPHQYDRRLLNKCQPQNNKEIFISVARKEIERKASKLSGKRRTMGDKRSGNPNGNCVLPGSPGRSIKP